MGTFNSNLATLNTANNYGYDELGQLTRDNQEEISNIVWRNDGKIAKITPLPRDSCRVVLL